MSDGLQWLTIDWFVPKGIVGLAAGYLLRVVEHVVWSRRAPPEQNPIGNFGFSLMIFPQSLLFGLFLGYVVLVGIALKIESETILRNCAYATSALLAFLAWDIRELLRRISRM